MSPARTKLELEFDAAIASGDLDAVEALMPRIVKKKPKLLFRAIEAGDVSRVRSLLNAGAALEGRHLGGTPLLIAVFELTEIERLPEFQAKKQSLLSIITLLIDRGADIHVRAPDGVSVLRLATTLADQTLAETLRARGAVL